MPLASLELCSHRGHIGATKDGDMLASSRTTSSVRTRSAHAWRMFFCAHSGQASTSLHVEAHVESGAGAQDSFQRVERRSLSRFCAIVRRMVHLTTNKTQESKHGVGSGFSVSEQRTWTKSRFAKEHPIATEQMERVCGRHTGSIRSMVLSSEGPFPDFGTVTENGNTFTFYTAMPMNSSHNGTLSDVVQNGPKTIQVLIWGSSLSIRATNFTIFVFQNGSSFCEVRF